MLRYLPAAVKYPASGSNEGKTVVQWDRVDEALREHRRGGGRALDEAAYLASWQKHVSGIESPFEQAVIGGILADRLSWVFVAGYQVAVRMAFSIETTQWVAYVASEDRERKLPGVTAEDESGSIRLNGFKTWVAAAAHVGQLVVRVNTDPPRHLLVARDRQGLQISLKPAARFLADLSQGVAGFSAVIVDRELPIENEVPFNLREALAIYSAFLGYLLGQDVVAAVHGQCRAVLSATEDLWRSDLQDERSNRQLCEFDVEVQKLRQQVDEILLDHTPGWESDRRLISMYSPGIQRSKDQP
jgi:hypothetical protein